MEMKEHDHGEIFKKNKHEPSCAHIFFYLNANDMDICR